MKQFARFSWLVVLLVIVSACGLVLPPVVVPPGPVSPPPSTPSSPATCAIIVGVYEGEPALDSKVVDARVVLSTSDGRQFEQRTDGAGNASFVPVPAGRYRLDVSAAGYIGAGQEIGCGVTAVSLQRMATPQPLATVRVTVRATVPPPRMGPERPLAGATVTLDGVSDPTITGPDGVATFAAVAPGPRHVWATAAGHQPADAHLEIPDTGELDASLSLAPIQPPEPRQVRGRLQARGRALTYADGARFRWRGVTGFRLLEQVAHGREPEASAFLTWAHRTGFNVVRVLAMAAGMFSLTPDEARAALPRMFELAREADVYVHITALADTASYPGMDFGSHVSAVGAACAAAEACALAEVANEPYHSTQASDVHDVAALQRWAARVPAGVAVALGPAGDDESREMTGAPVITAHLDRSRDPWNIVRRVRELETLSANTGRYVVDSEHIGAGEVDEPGRRVADPSIHFTFGALSRIFEVGSTFHFDDGLHARVPRPVQQAAAEAFIAGTRIVPDSAVLRFVNAGWPGGPVAKARFAEGPPIDHATVRAYSGLSSDRAGVLVLVGVRGDPGVVWGDGWKPGAVLVDRPMVRVIEIRR